MQKLYIWILFKGFIDHISISITNSSCVTSYPFFLFLFFFFCMLVEISQHLIANSWISSESFINFCTFSPILLLLMFVLNQYIKNNIKTLNNSRKMIIQTLWINFSKKIFNGKATFRKQCFIWRKYFFPEHIKQHKTILWITVS